MSFDFSGRSVIITGGGTGIGEAAAILLADQGAAVAVTGRRREPLDRVVAQIRDAGGTAIALPLDVADSDAVTRAVEAVVREFGALHLAVNNAGVKEIMRPLGTVTDAEWSSVTGVDLDGVFYSMRAEIDAMLSAGGGSIVNVASVQATQPLPIGGPYTASKAGVVGLTKTAALQYATQGIRANVVSPGVTDTPMVASEPESAAALAATIPMKRMAAPIETAHACAFLLSDEASYITGVDLAVDGGFLLQ